MKTALEYTKAARSSFNRRTLLGMVVMLSVRMVAYGQTQALRFTEFLISNEYDYAYGIAVGDLDGDGNLPKRPWRVGRHWPSLWEQTVSVRVISSMLHSFSRILAVSSMIEEPSSAVEDDSPTVEEASSVIGEVSLAVGKPFSIIEEHSSAAAEVPPTVEEVSFSAGEPSPTDPGATFVGEDVGLMAKRPAPLADPN